MTIEPQMRALINERIAECHVEAAAIFDSVEGIEAWQHRKDRPVHVHRLIKDLMKETGNRNERYVALIVIAAAIQHALNKYGMIAARLGGYQTGLRLLDDSYRGEPPNEPRTDIGN